MPAGAFKEKPDKRRFVSNLKERISTRWHMTLICVVTIASGVSFSKLLLFLHSSTPAWRYLFSVAFSYGVFFVLVHLWIRWHFIARPEPSGDSVMDAADLADIATDADLSDVQWGGGRGEFWSGSASSSWSETSSSGTESVKSSSFLADVGDAEEIFVIVLLIALVAAISGSALYLVYQAPEILLEAAFEAVLATGLLRKARGVSSEGWAWTLFRKTWLLFAVVSVAAGFFGYFIKHQCPEASSFAEYRSICWGKDKN